MKTSTYILAKILFIIQCTKFICDAAYIMRTPRHESSYTQPQSYYKISGEKILEGSGRKFTILQLVNPDFYPANVPQTCYEEKDVKYARMICSPEFENLFLGNHNRRSSSSQTSFRGQPARANSGYNKKFAFMDSESDESELNKKDNSSDTDEERFHLSSTSSESDH